MDKRQILDTLQAHEVPYELHEHTPVYTMEEMHALGLPGDEQVAKNLFLRDDKKRNYYLITVQGDQPVDLKQLRDLLQSRRLSFASEEDLQAYLGLQKGAVTPLGMLEDRPHRVQFFLDERFRGQRIGMHPGVNTATVFLQADDLMRMLSELGCDPHWLNLKPTA